MPRRKLAVAIVLAAAFGFLVAVLAPAPAEAIPPCGWHAKYYSDSSQTHLVGERWVTTEKCGCDYWAWGIYAYQVIVDDPICFSLEP